MFSFLLSFLISGYFYFALHFNGTKAFPLALSQKDEDKYFNLLKNGTDKEKQIAKEKLVLHNLRLVAHVIKKYYANEEKEDLISIGSIGLIKAVNSYKNDKGTRFATYAGKCIENEILMCFRNLKKTNQDVYINDSVEIDKDGNDITLIDKICNGENIQLKTETKMEIEKLNILMDKILTRREKEIIILRFGIGDFKPFTQKTIAKKMNISRSYVSRIETKALEKLRNEFEKT
ncbi:MAG: RNA polymerase sporulation sigma factor SigK [Oscillospiraceae bacterium]